MLKTCTSCSYIGNDSERTCPFCKADLSLAVPKQRELRSLGGNRPAHPAGSRASVPGLIACYYKRMDGIDLESCSCLTLSL